MGKCRALLIVSIATKAISVTMASTDIVPKIEVQTEVIVSNFRERHVYFSVDTCDKNVKSLLLATS